MGAPLSTKATGPFANSPRTRPPKKTVPAAVQFVDIAGLVKGAADGEGLGNKFLANIRETNAVLMMVRCFDDPNVVHVEHSVDPERDIEIIETELLLADLDALNKRIDRVARLARAGQKDAHHRGSGGYAWR